jgi:hypothetical protein
MNLMQRIEHDGFQLYLDKAGRGALFMVRKYIFLVHRVVAQWIACHVGSVSSSRTGSPRQLQPQPCRLPPSVQLGGPRAHLHGGTATAAPSDPSLIVATSSPADVITSPSARNSTLIMSFSATSSRQFNRFSSASAASSFELSRPRRRAALTSNTCTHYSTSFFVHNFVSISSQFAISLIHDHAFLF